MIIEVTINALKKKKKNSWIISSISSFVLSTMLLIAPYMLIAVGVGAVFNAVTQWFDNFTEGVSNVIFGESLEEKEMKYRIETSNGDFSIDELIYILEHPDIVDNKFYESLIYSKDDFLWLLNQVKETMDTDGLYAITPQVKHTINISITDALLMTGMSLSPNASLEEKDSVLETTKEKIVQMYMADYGEDSMAEATVSISNKENYQAADNYIQVIYYAYDKNKYDLSYETLYKQYGLDWQMIYVLSALNSIGLDKSPSEAIKWTEGNHVELDRDFVKELVEKIGTSKVTQITYAPFNTLEQTKRVLELNNVDSSYPECPALVAEKVPHIKKEEGEYTDVDGKKEWTIPYLAIQEFETSLAKVVFTIDESNNQITGIKVTYKWDSFSAILEEINPLLLDESFRDLLLVQIMGGEKTKEKLDTAKKLSSQGEISQSYDIATQLITTDNTQVSEAIETLPPDWAAGNTGNGYLPMISTGEPNQSWRTLTEYEKEQILKNLDTDSPIRYQMVKFMLDYVGKINYSQGKRNWNVDFPSYLDCSSFVAWVYRVNGMNLGVYPQTATMYRSLQRIALSDLKPGDLMFNADLSNRSGHVAIFIGYTETGNPVAIHCNGAGNGPGNVFYNVLDKKYLNYTFRVPNINFMD